MDDQKSSESTTRKRRKKLEVAAEPANAPPQPPPMRLPDLPAATVGGPPPWALIPEGIQFPVNRPVIFLRFKAAWTDCPRKGDRQCIVWPVNIGDKRLSAGRAGGDVNRIGDELVKGMIRVIDGRVADWSGVPGEANIDVWFDEIGEKSRTLLNRVYAQMHIVSADEARDFFENCVAVRVAGG